MTEENGPIANYGGTGTGSVFQIGVVHGGLTVHTGGGHPETGEWSWIHIENPWQRLAHVWSVPRNPWTVFDTPGEARGALQQYLDGDAPGLHGPGPGGAEAGSLLRTVRSHRELVVCYQDRYDAGADIFAACAIYPVRRGEDARAAGEAFFVKWKSRMNADVPWNVFTADGPTIW
jgi:hypothetical protein